MVWGSMGLRPLLFSSHRQHGGRILTIRKIFITYSTILAGLLILLLGTNSGLQLFYVFKTIDDSDSKTKLGKEGTASP